FEMLGNFSVGDYFKEGAVSLALEFLLQRLGLPRERLWITIFLDDDEAFKIWREQGISEDRILRFGEKDNFWGPAGDSGPCGPSSEIHYDFGPQFGCGRPSCAPNCDCGRFSELWNLVFVQYNQDSAGNRNLLPKPSVDTGMGLERATAVVQGQPSVYLTDLFAPMIELASRLSGKTYGIDDGDDNCMRVVTEHGRGITFLIADGVLPSNEGRGYVLRRLLRRAALFGRRLGLEKDFLVRMAEVTIDKMGHVYPELAGRRDFILKVVNAEEARFEETLSTGLELLGDILGRTSGQVRNRITGKQAFKLYDTYGFPVELTREIAQDRGFSVDEEGFEKEMEKQRARARASHKFELAKKVVVPEGLELGKTEFVGYSELKQKTSIQKILVGDRPVESAGEGQETTLVMASTPFYAEMGGQVGDTGLISGASGSFTVTATDSIAPGTVGHRGRIDRGSLSVDDEVTAEVDGERRLDIARNHTATHLLQFALRRVLGEHVQQRGSLVAPDRLRFDFSHLMAMTDEEKNEVGRLVNEEVRRNLPVYDDVVPYQQAVAEGAIALFDEKYGDAVRVLKIGKPPISVELCGGTHVAATGEIGFFQLVAESGIGGGLRRIEAVTGRGAEEMVKQRIDYQNKQLAAAEVVLEEERRRTRVLERDLAGKEAESLKDNVVNIKGVPVNIAITSSHEPELMREIADTLREKYKSGIVVLGTLYQDKPFFVAEVSPQLVKKGYHAGEIIKKVAGITGGSGGGKATLAQGGGKDKSKLDEAIRRVKDLI
ncbi:MAG: alanine--tRNA ligase, partial [Dehalococcoidales bacterium]|nr:alanine--tRNA ligase [Dehalococcoidales bacterium]